MTISTEYELLLQCARIDVPAGEIDRLANLLARGPRWKEVLRLATWHRLLGFVHRSLSRPELRDRVPASVLSDLKDAHQHQLVTNLLMHRELRRILERLAQHGVPVMLLKGAALLHTVFDDRGVRPMADLDVLVPDEELDRACELLRDVGYERRPDDRQTNSQGLIRPDLSCKLDLHRSIKVTYDLDAMWSRAVAVDVAGVATLVPAPEDLVVHLSTHFFADRRYDSRSALGQLCDISETARRHGARLDWGMVAKLASEHRLGTQVFVPLLAARRLVDAPVADECLTALRPAGFTDDLARLFLERRVLRARPWVSLELLRRGPRGLAVFPAIARREEGLSGPVGTREVARVYGGRALQAAKVASSSLLHVWEIPQDLRMNRTLRAYGDDEGSGPARAPISAS